MTGWATDEPGVLRLPSGRTVRGRAGAAGPPASPADLTVHLSMRAPPSSPGELCWLRWPDFWSPLDRPAAVSALTRAWRRAADGRVEVVCRHGRGRTGTALTCLAVLDGLPPAQAVAYVRRHYDRRAVETPGQARFVRRFPVVGATQHNDAHE